MIAHLVVAEFGKECRVTVVIESEGHIAILGSAQPVETAFSLGHAIVQTAEAELTPKLRAKLAGMLLEDLTPRVDG